MGDQQIFLESILQKHVGSDARLLSTSFESGGCINNTLRLNTRSGNYFIKWQVGIPSDMFEKEAEGLRRLEKAGNLRIPHVIASGVEDGKHYLLMEFIETTSSGQTDWEDFGRSLALLHRENSSSQYGFDHDNYIGKLPQTNSWMSSWIDFFNEHRLEYQLKLAMENRLVTTDFVSRYRKFYGQLESLLPVDQPALLHGDLWSGNFMTALDSKACLIDPATYYGHREIELSFTQMFGGFANAFYRSYEDTYPLEPGFSERVPIYNMYPHMVHVNLFGASYLGGVIQVLDRYV